MSRDLAATDFDRNLVVLAGAGTGKTSLLVERLLVALGSGRVTLDRVAALTFTEKAASELRSRLALGLERLRALGRGEQGSDRRHEADRAFARLEGEPPEAVAERALRAILALDGASIETIHGFCTRLLRSWPREAGVDPRFEVDRGPEGAAVAAEVWESFLAHELGPKATRTELFASHLDRVGLDDLEKLAVRLAADGLPEELLDPAIDPVDPRELLQANVGEADSAVTDALEQVGNRSRRGQMRAHFESLSHGLRAFREGGPDGLRAMIETDPALAQSLEDGYNPSVQSGTAKQVRRLLRRLAQVDDPWMRSAVEALAPFARACRERRLERGLLGFDAMLARAWSLLRDHPQVRVALRSRYTMILVDEVQDTDPLQYAITLALAGDEDGTLVPGKLFLVGDPKQSIYRFRGADYTAFRRTADAVIGASGAALDLGENWRSSHELLEAVHGLFRPPTSTVWSPSPYQPDYVAVRAAAGQSADSGPAVELWSLPQASSARARRDAEGRVVAAEIRDLVTRNRCRYGDVSILLRAFTSLPSLLRPLREAGIPFVVTGGRAFYEQPEVSHLLSVLRALACPANEIALLAFLRSPAGAVPDTELAAWAAGGGRWSADQKPDSLVFPRLARALEVLREWAASARDLSADQVVSHVLEQSGLLALHAAAFEGAQRVANLRKLAAKAAELARSGRLSLTEVVEALDSVPVSEREGESPLADEAMDAVQVLTVHGAKGLENRIVFVPDLAWMEQTGRWSRLSARAVSLPHGETSLALSLSGWQNAAGAWADLEETRHLEAESARLLYVAVTRARERLVLLAGPSRGRAPWVRALEAWGYDPADPPPDGVLIGGGCVLHRCVQPPARHSKVSALSTPHDLAPVHAFREAAAGLALRARPPFRVPSALEEERRVGWEGQGQGQGQGEGARRRAGRAEAKAVGTVVHLQLERWDLASEATLLAGVEAASGAAAREEGADPRRVEADARAVLERFLAGPWAARLRSVEIVGREVPLLLAEDGQVWRGTIDLLYRDRDGSLVVADYKTDRPGEGDLEARYREQLGVYSRAVARALGLLFPPRVELWPLR
jgi:ATP-dependent helicase/nuclease subunit A